jgi:phosphate starvation-inducible membrane PsiE
MQFRAETGLLSEGLTPETSSTSVGYPLYGYLNSPGFEFVGGKESTTFSNTTFNYDVLKKENWSTIGGIIFICLLIGFMVALVITKIFRLNFTFNLCIIIIITSIMMIILGDKFLKNAGVFILAGAIMTMILTVFIFLMNDIIRGPYGGKDIGDTANFT